VNEEVHFMRPYLAACALYCLLGAAFAHSTNPSTIVWLPALRKDETFLAANLRAAERKQILEQVEATSFDVPDSWPSELRLRRLPLGEAEGLVIRGTRLLCGGTGNCETWVFRRSGGQWLNLFRQPAPVISGLGFTRETTGGIKNLYVRANSAAEKESRTLYKFDGEFYRPSECYDVSLRAAKEIIEKVPCK
jgi:hypothetical protein